MPNAANAGIVVVGGSHAATQVAHVLRRLRQPGKITVISEEPVLPYHRPSLSKEFLKGNKTFDQILIRQEAMYAKANIDLVLGRRAVSVDRGRKTVGLDDGEVLDYTKLVLALGAQPRRLPIPGTDLDGVCYVRTVADIENMFAMISPGERAIVIGGGYIGLEAAASLRSLQMDVTVLESQERVLQRVTSPLMSEFFTRVHREEGVQIRVDESISEIVGSGRVSGVVLGNGQVEPASLVVVGIGIEPNIGLAENAGLAISNGIVVNEFGQTEDPDIYAAGDCTNFVHPRYQRAMRLESVQNANDQAMAVAKSISGTPEPYRAVPWFWSDQFDVKLQIAGLADGYDEIVRRGDSSSLRFSLCYLRNGRLQAVDAVNRPRDYVMGKKIITDDVPVDIAALADSDVSLASAATDQRRDGIRAGKRS